MNGLASMDGFGVLVEPATLKIERLLPGPIERVWDYLTRSDMRRKWLASGDMELKVGAPFELVWRNDELTDPPGMRPPEFSDEMRMDSRIIELDPPRRLTIAWGASSDVTFDLTPKGSDVLLTVLHRRLPDRATKLMVGAGWHMHLDILAALMRGTKPDPYWDGWSRLKDQYDELIPH